MIGVLALTGAACSSDDGGVVTPGADVVSTSDFFWDPADISVAVGDTVTWSWDGFHNVAFENDGPRSGEAVDVGTFQHTFDEAGTFAYVCEVHESTGMVGTVAVT